MIRFDRVLLAAVLVAGIGAPALAQEAASPAHDMTHGMDPAMPMAGGSQNASTQAFMAGMDAMHRDMDAPYSGDTDADFLRHMIPHHQGAIGMAEVELRYGRDPKVKRLARAVIAAQRQEIATMRRWLAQRGK